MNMYCFFAIFFNLASLTNSISNAFLTTIPRADVAIEQGANSGWNSFSAHSRFLPPGVTVVTLLGLSR